MSQSKWTIVNGVKWSLTSPYCDRTTIRGVEPPALWIPDNDVENPRPTFYHEGKEYVDICEISLERAIQMSRP